MRSFLLSLSSFLGGFGFGFVFLSKKVFGCGMGRWSGGKG